ncbi:MAG: dimethylsulfonioproprionate lyase family protein [Pseudomonadota bacterium]
MSLKHLFLELAEIFSAQTDIEMHARETLRAYAETAAALDGHLARDGDAPLADDVACELRGSDAMAVCATILDLPFRWAPPTSSADPQYVAHSLAKVHVELLGPDGLVPTQSARIGLYGMRPHAEYGLRTHPAEEIYVMLAGEADWMRGAAPYAAHGPGERSYHPSMLPHASRTRERSFLSVYAWRGDVSTDSYVYAGLPHANK